MYHSLLIYFSTFESMCQHTHMCHIHNRLTFVLLPKVLSMQPPTGEESRRGAYEAAKPGREGRRARAEPGEDGEGRRDESRRDEGEGEGEGEGEARRGEEGQYRQTNTVMIITFSKVPEKMYRRRYLLSRVLRKYESTSEGNIQERSRTPYWYRTIFEKNFVWRSDCICK